MVLCGFVERRDREQLARQNEHITTYFRSIFDTRTLADRLRQRGYNLALRPLFLALTGLASILILPHDTASSGLAPESLPSYS